MSPSSQCLISGSNKRRGGSSTNRKQNTSKRATPQKKFMGNIDKTKEDEKAEEKISNTEEAEVEESFPDHQKLCQRVAKSLYYAKVPCTPRTSLPLTMLAVNAFTNLKLRDDTLDFLDLDMASEIGRNACVSPTALIMALIYLERLNYNNPSYLTSVKPSELFVVSLLVASKFMQDDGEDCGIYNDEWASSAKLDIKRINQLEVEFLTAIDWNINVDKTDHDRVLREIEKKLALTEGLNRGWFTYTELEALSNLFLTWNLVLWPQLLKILSVTCIMYTSVFATIFGSCVLARRFFLVTKGLLTSKLALQHLNLNSLLIYIGLGLSGSSPGSYISRSNSTDILSSSHMISSSPTATIPLLKTGQESSNDTDVDILTNFLSSEQDDEDNYQLEGERQISFGLNRMSIAGIKGWSTTGDTSLSNNVDRGWYNNINIVNYEMQEKTSNISEPLHMPKISPTRVEKSFADFAFLYSLKLHEQTKYQKIGMNFVNLNNFLKT